MNKIISATCWLILITIMVSCNSNSDTLSIVVPTATTTRTIQPADTKILPPTASAPTETATSTLMPSPTLQALEHPITCLDIQADEMEEANAELPGLLSLVIPTTDDLAQAEQKQVVLLEGNSQSLRPLLPLQGTRFIGFSPDEKWFAYQMQDELETGFSPLPAVYLLSSQGEANTIPLPLQQDETDGHWYGQWISNDAMLIIYDLPLEGEEFQPHTYSLIDPVSGECKQEILNNLPAWDSATTPYFSSDMTRVVYVTSENQEDVFVLWNLETQEELWRQPFISGAKYYEVGLGRMNGFGSTITWSTTSLGFVYNRVEQGTSGQIVYSSFYVDRDGSGEQLLVQSPEPQAGIIYEGAWSPNGRYIAYVNDYFDTDEQRWTEQLNLYDFFQGKMIELCSGFSEVEQILWSPDSNYLAFWSQTTGDQFRLLIMDIYDGTVLEIPGIQNFLAAKWLADKTWLNAP